MKIRGKKFSLKQIFNLLIYYGFLYHLPGNSFPLIGGLIKLMRYNCCRNIFSKCGKGVNIEKGAFFASGLELSIGNESGLGYNSYVPANTVIGDNVMMGPNMFVLQNNHKFDRIDIPMNMQGFDSPKKTIIEDDVWIGRNVLFTPGRKVRKGSIIAAGTVLCKDFDSYSIVGGNPSRLIRIRGASE